MHVTSEDQKGGEHKSGQSKRNMFVEHLFGIPENSVSFFLIINIILQCFCTCSLHAYLEKHMFFALEMMLIKTVITKFVAVKIITRIIRYHHLDAKFYELDK
jgi:hypothetical protein